MLGYLDHWWELAALQGCFYLTKLLITMPTQAVPPRRSLAQSFNLLN
jgi:hypothetical protein